MNPRIDFWRNSHEWPRDSLEFIFLGRAVKALGEAMFGSQWDGSEFITEFPQQLPASPPHVSSGRSYFAHHLLIKHRPDFNRSPLKIQQRGSLPFSPMPPEIRFSSEEWAAALEIVKEATERARPALVRADQVMGKISEMAASGELRTALRPKPGGAFSEIPIEWWNTERARSRFDFCQMNPNKPFDIGSAGDQYLWIFISRESLLSCIGGISGTEQAPTKIAQQSTQPSTFEKPFTPSQIDGEATSRSLTGRASDRAMREAVANLVRNNPAANSRAADLLAQQLGANRDKVREALNAERGKNGNPVKRGRPRKR